jgi:hypothetical protein
MQRGPMSAVMIEYASDLRLGTPRRALAADHSSDFHGGRINDYQLVFDHSETIRAESRNIARCLHRNRRCCDAMISAFERGRELGDVGGDAI